MPFLLWRKKNKKRAERSFSYSPPTTDPKKPKMAAPTSKEHEVGKEHNNVPLDGGCFPLCQNFRKFRSRNKWNASVRVEFFRSKWSTSKGGPLWPVGPVWPKLGVPFSEIPVSSPALPHHAEAKMADGTEVNMYECSICKLQTQDLNILLMHSCTQGSGTALHLDLLCLLPFINF